MLSLWHSCHSHFSSLPHRELRRLGPEVPGVEVQCD
jgi:hypothetical protein